IWPHTVASAPSWTSVRDTFVEPHKNSIWVGFNSRAADMPIIQAECSLSGAALGEVKQLDLFRLGHGLSGSLSSRVGQLWPDADLSGVHRAMKDAYLTLFLLEGIMAQGFPLLDKIQRGEIGLGSESNPQAQKKRRPEFADVS